jgi:hypothetical protein
VYDSGAKHSAADESNGQMNKPTNISEQIFQLFTVAPVRGWFVGGPFISICLDVRAKGLSRWTPDRFYVRQTRLEPDGAERPRLSGINKCASRSNRCREPFSPVRVLAFARDLLLLQGDVHTVGR